MGNLHKITGPGLFLAMFLILLGSFRTLQAQELKVLEPEFPMWIKTSDALKIMLKAPPGSQAVFSVTELAERFPMAEIKPGCFTGIVIIPQNAPPELEISISVTTLNRTQTLIPGGKVKVLPYLVPTMARAKTDVVLRSGPGEQYDRIAFMPKNAVTEICGLRGEWINLALTKDLRAWTERAQLQVLPPGSWEGCAQLQRVQSIKYNDGVHLTAQLTQPVPYALTQSLKPDTLTLTLYQTLLAQHDIMFAPGTGLIKQVAVTQTGDTTAQMAVSFNHKFGGFLVQFKPGKVIVILRNPPRVSQGLKGLKIMLDPGHGGLDYGAVGFFGMKEKDLNYRVAMQLKKLLRAGGAQVFFTRWHDYDLMPEHLPAAKELQARVQQGMDRKAHLFVSIHHNALPDISDARTAKGCEVYFYYAQSQELARQVALNLSRNLPESDYKFLWRSFYVIRQTYAPAILIEAAYISNPREEITMRSQGFAYREAMGIYRGIVTYLQAI